MKDRKKKNKLFILLFLLKIAILFVPIILTKYLFDVRTLEYSRYEKWGLEDGLFENIQVIFFFLCFLVSLYALFKSPKNKKREEIWLWILFVIGFFLVTMEEISWGQRLLDLDTFGKFSEHNVQNEINLHNMSHVYDLIRFVYIGLGLWGTFGWIMNYFMKFIQKILSKTLALQIFIKHLIPPWFTTSYFLMLLINIFDTYFLAPQDLEYFEMLSSIGIFLFIFVNLVRSLNSDKIKRTIDSPTLNIK